MIPFNNQIIVMDLSKAVSIGERCGCCVADCPPRDHGAGGVSNQTDDGNDGVCRDMHHWRLSEFEDARY